MKYSIVIPCYNIAPYIERCLDSILVQVFSDYEIILINDGSTDNLLDIIQDKYKTEIKLSVYSSPNKGVCSARNKGMQIAKGDWMLTVKRSRCK